MNAAPPSTSTIIITRPARAIKQAERWKDGMRSVVQHNTMVTEVLDSKTHLCGGRSHGRRGKERLGLVVSKLPPTSSGGQIYVTLPPAGSYKDANKWKKDVHQQNTSAE